LFVLALSAVVVFGCRCTTLKPTPDPLAGWSHYFNAKLDSAIINDYQDYIKTLPSEERKLVDENSVEPLENGTGCHAVKIEIPIDGTYWEHVLIYDLNNKRIKNLKYKGGHYQS
jgi:hypothetical protein